MGSDGTAWIVLGTRPGEFDNATGAPEQRKARNTVGLYADQTSGLRLEDFGIRSETRDGLYLRAVSVFRSDDLVISGLEIKDFSVGYGIVVESSRDGVIKGNYIHDFHSEHTQWGQLTGIELDNDRDGAIGPSHDLRIVGNRIEDLTVGPAFDAAFGYQTDGITVAAPYTHDVTIADNRIVNIGEGIDVFGEELAITGNTISNAAYFGIKLAHGAQRTTVESNVIDAAGFAGILLSGGINAGLGNKVEAVNENSIIGNTISGIGQADMGFPVQIRFTPPVGIYLEGREDGFEATGNTLAGNVVTGNDIAGSGSMTFGIFCSNGNDNIFADNDIAGAERAPVENRCNP